MNGSRRRLALALIAAFAGCGSSAPLSDGGTGSGADGSRAADLAMPPDLSNGFQCGATSCGAGTRCCVANGAPGCASSCPDGGFIAECRGPENCDGDPCCVTITSGFVVHDVSCTTSASACPPMIDATTGAGQDRACRVDADCTSGAAGTMLPDCCTNTQSGQKVCFNKSYLSFVQGFTCP